MFQGTETLIQHKSLKSARQNQACRTVGTSLHGNGRQTDWPISSEQQQCQSFKVDQAIRSDATYAEILMGELMDL